MSLRGDGLKRVLRGSDGVVVIGPVVWEIPPAHDSRYWYFILGTGKHGGRHFFTTQVTMPGVGSYEEAQRQQAALLVGLASAGRPLVIRTFGDELQMAEFAVGRWPCAKSRRILRDLRLERAASAAVSVREIGT